LDVSDWKRDLHRWNFEFDTVNEVGVSNPLDKTKTSISISELSADSKNSFGDELFYNALKIEISKEHFYALSKGLRITINGSKLKLPTLTLINNSEFKPAFWH